MKKKKELIDFYLELPRDLLEDVDKLCSKEGLTLQEFIEKAVEDFISGSSDTVPDETIEAPESQWVREV